MYRIQYVNSYILLCIEYRTASPSQLKLTFENKRQSHFIFSVFASFLRMSTWFAVTDTMTCSATTAWGSRRNS